MNSGLSSCFRFSCHCEPARTLVWQSQKLSYTNRFPRQFENWLGMTIGWLRVGKQLHKPKFAPFGEESSIIRWEKTGNWGK